MRALAAVLTVASLAACTGARSAASARCAGLEAALTAELQTLRPVGALGAVLVVDAPRLGRVSATVGDADVDGTPLTRTHAFEVGSQTKTFTAAAIVRLANEGVINLDDPVSRWVAGVAGGETVTLRHLLNHTSGLGDGVAQFDTPGAPPNRPVPFEEIARLSAEVGPAFAPGEGWAYNNFGFDILGVVIARATGEAPAAYIRRTLTAPLDLRHTGAASVADWPAQLAHGYQSAEGVRIDLGAPRDLSWASSAGDMISTGDDMIGWVRALAADDARIGVGFSDLSAGFVALPDNPAMPRYGYGLMERPFGDTLTWGHGGFIHGYISYAGVAQTHDIAFSIMTNLNGDPDIDHEALIERLGAVAGQALMQAKAAIQAGETHCGS